jgi:DNA-binding transcriptional MerR regulator
MKTGELAKRLGIHASTVRSWASDYAAFLSPKPAGKDAGSPRNFSEQDAQVLTTVANMREKGFGHDAIEAALAIDTIESTPEPPSAQTIPASPPLPPLRPDASETPLPTLKPDETIVPVAQVQRTLDEFRHLQKDLERVEAERDRILARWEQDSSRLTERVIDLEGKIGEFRGELRAIRRERKSSDWWLRVLIAAVLVTIILMALTTILILNPPF